MNLLRYSRTPSHEYVLSENKEVQNWITLTDLEFYVHFKLLPYWLISPSWFLDQRNINEQVKYLQACWTP